MPLGVLAAGRGGGGADDVPNGRAGMLGVAGLNAGAAGAAGFGAAAGFFAAAFLAAGFFAFAALFFGAALRAAAFLAVFFAVFFFAAAFLAVFFFATFFFATFFFAALRAVFFFAVFLAGRLRAVMRFLATFRFVFFALALTLRALVLRLAARFFAPDFFRLAAILSPCRPRRADPPVNAPAPFAPTPSLCAPYAMYGWRPARRRPLSQAAYASPAHSMPADLISRTPRLFATIRPPRMREFAGLIRTHAFNVLPPSPLEPLAARVFCRQFTTKSAHFLPLERAIRNPSRCSRQRTIAPDAFRAFLATASFAHNGMMRFTARLCALAAILLAGMPPVMGGETSIQNDSAKDVPASICSCRNRGTRVPVGGTACLQTPEGPRQARCVMQQNIPSWTIGRESCPLA